MSLSSFPRTSAAAHGHGARTCLTFFHSFSVGGRKVEHLRDNIKSLSIKLTPDQMAKLEAVAPIEPGFPNIFVSIHQSRASAAEGRWLTAIVPKIGEDPHVTGSAGGFLGGTAALSFTKARAPPDPK